MTRERLAALLFVLSSTSCELPPYPDRAITCDPADATAPCPDGYACLDVTRRSVPVCVKTGCGDGVVNPSLDPETGIIESCDDGNENDLDTCDSSCRAVDFVPSIEIGLGVGGGRPLETELGQPGSLAVDRAGNVVVASFASSLITRYDVAAGAIAPFAGNGSIVSVGGGDGVPPNEVAVPIVGGLAVDGAGNVFVADLFSNVIRRVDGVTGTSTVVVANRPGNFNLGTREQDTATTSRPQAVAVDGDGALYFIDHDDVLVSPVRRIRRVDPITGRMQTIHDGRVAGGGSLGLGDIDFDEAGVLYSLGVGDFFTGLSGRILVIEPNGPTRIVPLPGACLEVQNAQRKLAVSPDGQTGFYAVRETIMRVTLERTGSGITASCTAHATLPLGDPTSVPIGGEFGEPGAFDVAWARTPDGDFLLAADPTTHAVWRIAVDEEDTFEPMLGIVVEDVPGGDPAGALAADIVTNLALETDGRINVSETRDCRGRQQPDTPRIDRFNLEVFAAFPEQHSILQITCFDSIGVIAGSGVPGDDDGEGDPLRARLNNPVAAVRGRDQNIYIADRDNDAIRKLTLFDDDGTALPAPVFGTLIDTREVVAGAPLTRPAGLAVDDSGALLISDSGNDRVLRVDPRTLDASILLDGLAEPSAIVFLPYAFSEELLGLAPACDVERDALTADPCGLLIVAERSGHRVRGVALEPLLGIQLDLAGTPADEEPTPGDRDAVEVDGEIRSELRFPRGLMLDVPSSLSGSDNLEDLDPNLLIVDSTDRLRRMRVGQLQVFPPALVTSVTTVTSLDDTGIGYPSSDDASGGSGLLRAPASFVALDADRLIVLEGVSGRLRLFTRSTGELVTVAGLPDGAAVPDDESAAIPAAAAVPMTLPEVLALDAPPGGPAFLYATEPSLGRVRRFHLTNLDDPSTWTTDVLPLAPGTVRAPAGLAVDAESGALYIADRAAHVVVRVTREGQDPVVVAGRQGLRGFAGDADPATSALLNAPSNVLFARSPLGPLLFIADSGNQRVRRVVLDDNVITTVLGDGSSGSGGEGAPAFDFPVKDPRGLTLDPAGNLLVTSGNAIRMLQADTYFRKENQDGVVDRDDAVATIYGKAPRDRFPEPATRCLADVEHVEGVGLLALDSCVGLLFRLDRR